jgi:hypothetical protein
MKAAPFLGIIALAASASVLSCGNVTYQPEWPAVSTVPLKLENRWVYERDYIRVPFEPSSVPDTEKFGIDRLVQGFDDTLSSTRLAIVRDWIYHLEGDYDPYAMRYWFAIEGSKLQTYAYQMIVEGVPGQVYVIDPPYIWLDFPLNPGKSWIMSPFNEGVKRRVVGYEWLAAVEKEFWCAQVETETPLDPNMTWYEWYSDEGLISEEIDYGTEYMRDEYGRIIDSVHAYQETRLVEIYLNSE